jgi:GNAT superfamily N-acetyltransferase
MPDLPESLFANPVWHALQTNHQPLALTVGDACRYPADVAPFAALAAPTTAALRDLHTLLAPTESVWVFDLLSQADLTGANLTLETTLDCLQMVLPHHVTPPEPHPSIVPLASHDAPDMVALTDLAFPGFFRPRTYAMGSYFGIRAQGQLIAMGGERLMLPGYAEISGLCTHPDHRGRGHAASLIGQLVRTHRPQGIVSWLHVGAANQRAIDLYLNLGFEIARKLTLHRLTRTPSTSPEPR